jgi:lysozyme
MFDETFEEFSEFEDSFLGELEGFGDYELAPEEEEFEEFSELEDSPARPLYLGLDTASVAGNKNPDWARAKTHGKMSFAIIRAVWGTTVDKVFARDWPKLKAAGLVRGAYMFQRFPHPKYKKAPPSPEAQVRAFINTVGKLDPGDLPPSLDVEFPGGRAVTKLSAQKCLDQVRVAWKALKAEYGVAPIIYTSARVWREDLNNLAAPDLIESPLWLARYPLKQNRTAVIDGKLFRTGRHDPPVPPPFGDKTNWWIHQYQGDALRLPGFPSGNVDLNRFDAMLPGDRGDRVKWMQRRLGVRPSGTLDPATETALKRFQSTNGLQPSAVVDPRTFAYLCWSHP